MTTHSERPWWKGAVIYEVYPRSFQDSNDDGIGDLPGLIQRLPYIASLGVDALWVTPFFKSPQCDFGYDVSDYRDVDAMFGDMEDCDNLIAQAHKLGLKIIFDTVLSHSSDLHPWFQDSRRRLNGKDDWYVWADPKPDGSPPNNWFSMFGGSAWTFDSLRGQYYLHNFLKEQPDLNFHNPDVQDAMLDVVKFWLDRGVDGLRLDVVTFYFHDKDLRNNPPRPEALGTALQFNHRDPYSMQEHIYNKSRPENLVFLERLRALADSYDNRVLIGEINDDHRIARVSEYTYGRKRLHTAYCDVLMLGTGDMPFTPSLVRQAAEDNIRYVDGMNWPSWAFSNHDVPRAASRLGPKNINHPNWPKMLMALLLSLRGSICIYQGEELGLPEANVPRDRLRDPWGKRVSDIWQGRDGCRTPMPWNDALTNFGFSGVDGWLPAAPEHQGMAVGTQEEHTDSMLHVTRKLLKYRHDHPALLAGDIAFLESSDRILAFTRGKDSETILCVFNFDSAPARFDYAGVTGGSVSLEGFGFAFVGLSPASSSLASAKSF